MAAAAVRVRLAVSPGDWAGAVAVRLAVFAGEQGVPADIELDEQDRTALHAVAVIDEPADDAAHRVLERDRASVALRAAALAGKYLPLTLAGARSSTGGAAPPAAVVGTARLVGAPAGAVRIGRLAVLRSWRGRGVGSRLLRLLEEAALARGACYVQLHAQLAVEGFYTRHGYQVAEPRDEFVEDGIDHVRMTKPLSVEM